MMTEQLVISLYAFICFIWLSKRYGFLSVEFIVAAFIYIPSLSVLYRIVRGADYVNYQNYVLQENSQLMFYSLLMICISLTMTLAYLKLSIKKYNKSSSFFVVKVIDYPRSTFFQILLIILFTIFFSLADKGGIGDTIFNASYSDLLEKRLNNTEYAAVLAIVFWIWSFIISLNKKRDFFGRQTNIIFTLATIWNLVWLFLHSSRMPFILIVNVYILYLILSKKKKQALTILVTSFSMLTLLGWVRELIYDPTFSFSFDEELVSVASLPGGASNVLMSFVIVCDFFKNNDFLYGQTFLNYLLQLPPGPLTRLFNYNPPPYFDSIGIFDLYDWNGGVNAASIFYANFGVLGMIIYGLLVGTYIKSINYFLRSNRLFKQVAGYFMFAFSMPIFWYELIQFIKPMLFILLLFLINEAVRIAVSRTYKLPINNSKGSM